MSNKEQYLAYPEQILDFSQNLSQKMIQQALEKLKSYEYNSNLLEIKDEKHEELEEKIPDQATKINNTSTEIKQQEFKLLKQEIYVPGKGMKKIKSTQPQEFQSFKVSTKLYKESFQRKKQKEMNEIKKQCQQERDTYQILINKKSDHIIKAKQDQGEYTPIQQRQYQIQQQKKEKITHLQIQKQFIQMSPPTKIKSHTPNFKATIDRFDQFETKRKSKINDQIEAKKVTECIPKSFQPNINDRSRNIFESTVKKNMASPDVVSRLLDKGQQKQTHITELRKKTQPTFQP